MPTGNYHDCPTSPIVWRQDEVLFQQYNRFLTISPSFEETNACLLTVFAAEGPFYLPNMPVRRDIREDQSGAPLHVRIKIVDVRGCMPIPNAEASVWHANAFGIYSGYEGVKVPPYARIDEIPHLPPLNDKTFLRGRQFSDDSGLVEFDTIYPGWYHNRTVHIHLKIFWNGQEMLTTQLFFPQALNYKIQSQPPYNVRPISPYINENDGILRYSSGVEGGWPRVVECDGAYTATLTVGILLPD